eukprot:7951292-Pyramimonas_sp.AAC.1
MARKGGFMARKGGFKARKGGFMVRKGGFMARKGRFMAMKGGFMAMKGESTRTCLISDTRECALMRWPTPHTTLYERMLPSSRTAPLCTVTCGFRARRGGFRARRGGFRA